jgi:uncharacterized protein YoxC
MKPEIVIPIYVTVAMAFLEMVKYVLGIWRSSKKAIKADAVVVGTLQDQFVGKLIQRVDDLEHREEDVREFYESKLKDTANSFQRVLDEINIKLKRKEEQHDACEEKHDKLEAAYNQLESKFESKSYEVEELRKRVASVEKKVDS